MFLILPSVVLQGRERKLKGQKLKGAKIKGRRNLMGIKYVTVHQGNVLPGMVRCRPFKFQKTQYQEASEITGTWRVTSRNKRYDELG